MAATTTATWVLGLSVVVGRRVLRFLEAMPVVSNLFNVMNEGDGLTGRVSRMPDVRGSISDPVTEGAAVSTATTTVTSGSLTPSVTGIAFEVTDLLTGSTPFAGLGPFLEAGADVLVEQSEDDIHALIAALNGGTHIGVTETPMTLAILLEGLVALKVAQAPGPFFGALAPIAVADLAADLGGLGGIAGGTSVGLVETAGGRPGLKGVVSAVPIYEAPRAPTITAGEDRESCVANRDAISVRVKWAIRPEMQRNALNVSTELVITNAYGLAETADDWGIPITSDA